MTDLPDTIDLSLDPEELPRSDRDLLERLCEEFDTETVIADIEQQGAQAGVQQVRQRIRQLYDNQDQEQVREQLAGNEE